MANLSQQFPVLDDLIRRLDDEGDPTSNSRARELRAFRSLLLRFPSNSVFRELFFQSTVDSRVAVWILFERAHALLNAEKDRLKAIKKERPLSEEERQYAKEVLMPMLFQLADLIVRHFPPSQELE